MATNINRSDGEHFVNRLQLQIHAIFAALRLVSIHPQHVQTIDQVQLLYELRRIAVRFAAREKERIT
jgi:hypothetical protein